MAGWSATFECGIQPTHYRRQPTHYYPANALSTPYTTNGAVAPRNFEDAGSMNAAAIDDPILIAVTHRRPHPPNPFRSEAAPSSRVAIPSHNRRPCSGFEAHPPPIHRSATNTPSAPLLRWEWRIGDALASNVATATGDTTTPTRAKTVLGRPTSAPMLPLLQNQVSSRRHSFDILHVAYDDKDQAYVGDAFEPALGQTGQRALRKPAYPEILADTQASPSCSGSKPLSTTPSYPTHPKLAPPETGHRAVLRPAPAHPLDSQSGDRTGTAHAGPTPLSRLRSAEHETLAFTSANSRGCVASTLATDYRRVLSANPLLVPSALRLLLGLVPMRTRQPGIAENRITASRHHTRPVQLIPCAGNGDGDALARQSRSFCKGSKEG
uniref:Uncharacterized protein n=1 Tax=Mycena chlorophos TaxID=658473 RepID=A0ABQ0L7N9_MYCCL|nr:predicted protein [Mycena chlorophos]